MKIKDKLTRLLLRRQPESELSQAEKTALNPRHVAVVMDGNGRWAQQRGLPRSAGHRAGAQNLRRFCQLCIEQEIRYVTVFAFSTENWSRSTAEVETLMNLFVEFFTTYDRELAQRDIRLRFSGEREGLPDSVLETIEHAEQSSARRTAMQLIVAFNYGGRAELVKACQQLAGSVAGGQLTPDEITESLISSALYLPDVPDPDLVIRPSGELRLSNFLLWQSAYAELWFSDVLWPDFSQQDFLAALADYRQRERRFGGVKTT